MSRCGEAWQEMQNMKDEQWPPQDDGWAAWAEEQEQGSDYVSESTDED